MRTKEINKLNRKLKISKVLFACLFVFMIFGLVEIISSIFIWVWYHSIWASRIGFIGLLTFFISWIGWLLMYILMKLTINDVKEFKNESN